MVQDQRPKDVDDLIDQNLRLVYDTVLEEDVPERFAQLLAQLQANNGKNADETTRDEA